MVVLPHAAFWAKRSSWPDRLREAERAYLEDPDRFPNNGLDALRARQEPGAAG